MSSPRITTSYFFLSTEVPDLTSLNGCSVQFYSSFDESDLGVMFHNVIKKKIFLLLVVLLNSGLYYNFLFFFCFFLFFVFVLVIVFFLPLFQDSVTTWQNTNLKINFINYFIWFIRLSVKFFNNVWYIQNAHELHIKICFINIVYCIFYICSGVYRVSLF